ncbi:MAG TPA: alpha-L-fucosidase [Armatimonadota bacterium]|nr:alpha-L-fucosidase [Armatimonadota bacterium]
MHNPKWCLFYDVHTQPALPDVGEGFDPEAWADRFQRCGVDYVVFHARCNMGMAYYNTKIGIRHPSLKYDLFGAFVEACQKRNIAVTAYVNVGLSHEEGLLHRDWLVLNPDGTTYLPNRMGNFMRMMCPNTGYGDHVVAMCREIVENYPVAGLFLDCMHQHPCVGVECIREMKQRGIDWEDPRQLREFANFSRVRIAQRIADAAKSVRPDLLLYFNGVSYEYQQEIGTYLEYECLPTGGWGYEALPLYGRFLRTLGKPLLNMTGRFHRSWGDFGGIRTEASLEYDCLYGLALGMRTTIGDHFHPRGDLNTAVFDLIERVYGRLQKLEPWIDGAKGAAEIAVVAPEPGFCYVHPEEFSQSQAALKGCARMLCELKQQFDVVSMARSWEGYRLLILPDLVLLDPAAADKARKHLAQGGAILSTGWSGADPEKKAFVLKEWGVKLEGEDPFDPAFLLVGEALSEGMPDMPITLYDRGTAIAAVGDTEVLATIGAPYFNRHWDGEHHFFYLPPDKPTNRPAVTVSGPVAHISHPLFTSYYNHAQVPMRTLIGHLIARLMPNEMVKTEGMPSFGRVTVTRQPNRRMVHLLSYVPERRGATIDMIEEPVELRDIAVALREDGQAVSRVYLAPTGQDLPFEVAGGYVKTRVPVVPGYAMVVFE